MPNHVSVKSHHGSTLSYLYACRPESLFSIAGSSVLFLLDGTWRSKAYTGFDEESGLIIRVLSSATYYVSVGRALCSSCLFSSGSFKCGYSLYSNYFTSIWPALLYCRARLLLRGMSLVRMVGTTKKGQRKGDTPQRRISWCSMPFYRPYTVGCSMPFFQCSLNIAS